MSNAPSVLGTNYGQKFAQNSLKSYFDQALSPQITNDNWEADLTGGRADRVNILTFAVPGWVNYTGADITFQDVSEIQGVLQLSVQRSNSFQIKDWNRFKSYATDPESQEVYMRAEAMKREVDQYNLGFYKYGLKSNFVGTDYTTGTVTVDASGNVTGSGTTFTSGMVGCGFVYAGTAPTVAGQFARVATFVNATSITLMDDADDIPTQFTAASAAAGASYTIKAASVLQVTSATIDATICKLKENLDQEGPSGTVCPDEGRFLVVPSKIHTLMMQSAAMTPYTPSAYEDAVKLGIVGQFRGFKVFKSERVSGNNGTGFYCLAGHRMGITHAFVPIGGSVVTDLQNNYGRGFKQLVTYGSKVLDNRKQFLATMWVYV